MIQWSMPALIVALGTFGAPAHAEVTTDRIAWIVDGDTFHLWSGERIRIADIDAPETRRDQARCPAEFDRGRAAAREAIVMLKGRTVTIERIGHSYGRTVARVRLDGRDLGDTLVARGIARPWPQGRPKPDWCR